MYSTKVDVDRHVEECLKKINNETERNLRCLSFAKQYFNIERYEEARRYVSTYLSARPNSAEGHYLLGKALEKLGKKEAARQAYTTSLRLDPKQNNLVFKVCELLASDDVDMDQTGAKYFCDMAQSLDPQNPAIFNLKQRLVSLENDDPHEIASFILKELETRPTDVKLRVRLLKHLLQHSYLSEAYKHVSDIESKDLTIFHNITWYETVAEVLVKYQRSNLTLDWQFWFLSVSVLDKLVGLTLDEQGENIKTTIEYVNTLFNFDQTLLTASLNIKDCPDKHLIEEFLGHYRAQLCFHLATLVFKQAHKDLIKYKEASNITLPLLFASYHSHPPDLQSLWFNHAPEARRNLVRKWRKEAVFRCSQSGHILLAAAQDRKSIIIEKATQYSVGMWREQLFKKLFITRDQQLKKQSSYFVTDQQLSEIVLRLPENTELLKYDEEAQLIFPDSLHHHIWIALNNKLSELKCVVFEGLQYSVKNLKNCGAETLNVLDIQAFIWCATVCAKSNLESARHISYYNLDKPNVLPAAVTQELGTLNQNKFFKAAYKMYKNEYDPALDQLRLILVNGIKTLRCVDNGLDVQLLITLAKTFAERSKLCTKQSEIEFNEARAELYWKAALPILEKLKNNQAVSYPPNKLFSYKPREISLTDICAYIESGKLFTSTQLMKKKEYEKALRLLEILKDPYASFYQAQIYKFMAGEQTNQNKENVTSEMRSQNIILLSRARDCLYLTLDRLREPSVDQKHPLNSQLGTEIEKIEHLLSRIDPDCTNRNECDGMSDENVSSSESAGDHYVTSYTGHNTSYFNGIFTSRGDNLNHSTPYRSNLLKREARPSPERLDAQLRQLTATKDAAIVHILEHNKIMAESHRTLVEAVNNLTATVDELKNVKHSYEELKDVKKSVIELKASIEELDFRSVTDTLHEVKKEIAELKKDVNKTSQLSEEDIYGLASDYGADYNINSNLAAYPNLYSNYQARLPGATSLYGPPPLYPGMYPMPYAYGGLALPQTGGLPFGSEQDFRTISAALNQVQPNVTYGPNTVPSVLSQTTPSNLFRDPRISASQSVFPTTSGTPVTSTPASKAPPVNVVITTSDPLPSTKTPTSQPVLSVVIPPQHLKGKTPKSQPHNYQIPLPATTLANTSPSVLSKPAPTVATESILSNVAPPVYSAVADKTPVNVSLGLQIEKSLEQTFNSSKDDAINKSNVSTSSVEEHDPCPDFKPIIPLPDEVPITTGEESETVLFCERAKLFRYAKEWKERGVGVLKILLNPETKKFRILMRRDQVFKVCANHYLTKEMVLTAKNERAYMWAAHDYADEEVVLEKLCARFKSPEEARRFYETVESAKKSLLDADNKKDARTGDVKESDKTGAPSLGGFVFSGTPTFKLKQDVVTPTISQPEIMKVSPFSSFTFGAKPTSHLKSDFTPLKDSDAKPPGDDDDFVPTTEFKPVVPLPELVEVKTGEENAEVLFESKAKLLRLDASGATKEWKEKGIGIIKLLKDDTVRLVMRRDQVLKVCCNHQLLKNMEFKGMPTNATSLTWCAKDFSEGVLKPETFAIRFKTEELANSFLRAIASAQASLDENSSVVSRHIEKHVKTESPAKPMGFGDKFKPIKGSWDCKICYVVNDGKENYCVACDTPKNDTVPKKSDDSSGEAFSFGVSKGINSWGDSFTPKEGSWECKVCYVRNDFDKTLCVSCENSKDDTIWKKTPEKGVSLDTGGLKFSFGIQPSKTVDEQPEQGDHLDVLGQKYTFGLPASTTQTTATFTFGQSTIPVFGATTPDTSASSPFVFKPNTSHTPAEKKDVSTEKFVFGSPQKHDFEFTPRSPRRVSNGAKDEESDCSYVEEEGDNIYFKPVIPLPDKVEVKTGEEDEEVLYCHRAKLYRFTAGEWKERGIGEVKILKRKNSGKLRVLMRREQVFKICLNHFLTSNITYLAKDDKTWLFCAPDFSEGEIVNEQFCIRFKTAEIAQEFMKSVNDALSGTSRNTGISDGNVDDEEVEFISGPKVTPEEEEEARKLGLPPKFMCYRQLPDCECEQCKKDDEYLRGALGKIPSTKSSTNFLQATPSQLSTNVSSTSSSIFVTPNDDGLVSKSSTSSLSSSSYDTLKDILSKPSLTVTPKTTPISLFSSPSFFSVSNSPNSFASPTSSNLFSSKSTGSFFQTPSDTTKNQSDSAGFSFGGLTNFGVTSSTATNTTASVFGSSTNLFGTTGNIFGGTKSVGSLFGSANQQSTLIFGDGSSAKATVSSNSIFSTPQSVSVFGNVPTFVSTPPTTPGSVSKNASIFGAATGIFGNSGVSSGFNSSPAIFGTTSESSKPLFGGGDAAAVQSSAAVQSIFGGSTTPAKSAEPTTSNLKEDDAAVLDCNSGLSFASLAAKTSSATPDFAKGNNESHTTPFTFLGAGAPVFASATNDTKNKSLKEDSSEKAAGDEDYDPHYDPIVPLPDQIVVSTGEEDETPLFNERAKLFRYDGDNKEWKERGVGQMKILYHPVNSTHRFLLRREQVHKVVLNQLIIPDLELQPMKTSDKAWIWAGYNYTDDDSSLEKLAVKFKTCELARNFHKTVQDVVAKLKTLQSEKPPASNLQASSNEEQEVTVEVDLSKFIPSSIQNYGLEDVSSDEQSGIKDVSYEDEEDEDEEGDDEDDRTLMFMKRCTLSEEVDGEWKVVTLGELQVYYDPDLYGTRICVNSDSGDVASNTVIGVNTVMQIDKNSCFWKAVECGSGEMRYRTLKAIFSSTAAAQEFHSVYLEGLNYARECDLVDELPDAAEQETDA